MDTLFCKFESSYFFVGTGTAPACFLGFSCCDAILRHEGCFFSFSVAGLPKLASEQAGYEEETTGVALASQQGFYWFLLHALTKYISAMWVNELLICFCTTKLSDFLTWPNPEQLFVAQDVIRY